MSNDSCYRWDDVLISKKCYLCTRAGATFIFFLSVRLSCSGSQLQGGNPVNK